MSFNYPVFGAFASVFVGYRLYAAKWGSGVSDENASSVVLWYRRQGAGLKAVIDLPLLFTAAYAGQYWWTHSLIPAINAGPLSLAVQTLVTLISAGLGVSIGRQITHKNFKTIEDTND